MPIVRTDIRIPTRDGIHLAATLIRPDEPAGVCPAVFNLDPYRKDDWSAAWDLSLGTFLAERGFAYCRADVRGTGSSDGVALDEYTEAETRDGYDAVEWLAAQPWCNGSIGMWGLSYGGFTSLQVAALRPPHLKAIVPIQATDDRYTDDVHYVGGAMTVSELAQYAVSQVATNALPPLPEAWGEGWRERWRERLEATPPWLIGWARDQRDGPTWRRGSIATDYGAITAAILQFGGWMDEYVDAALRIQARCTSAAARRTIVGPWVHGLPDHAYPGPNIDWLGELVRWFDRFLRGKANGIDDEPPLIWYQRDPTPPERFPKALAGSWRATDEWPAASDGAGERRHALFLDDGDEPRRGRLVEAAATTTDGEHRLRHHPTSGALGGSLCWGAGHPPNGLAADLRLEEPVSLVYTTDVLDRPLEILGPPVAVLHLASSQPVAQVVVRLGAVAPDGSVEQVCEGLLNLTHRDSHADPTALEPGRTYVVRVPMRSAGYRFPAGVRICLAIATAHWPVAWPAPGGGELTIRHGPADPSRLELPLAPLDARPATSAALTRRPPTLPSFGDEASEPPRWSTVEDPETGDVTVSTYEAATSTLLDGRSTLFLSEALTMTASAREPGTGRSENTCEYRLARDGLDVRVVADGAMTAGVDAFEMVGSLSVELDGNPFFERRWREQFPRDLL